MVEVASRDGVTDAPAIRSAADSRSLGGAVVAVSTSSA